MLRERQLQKGKSASFGDGLPVAVGLKRLDAAGSAT
jgi:hypothetical protein